MGEPLFLNYKGWKVPTDIPNIETRLNDFAENFKSRSDDVWICAYAKCGTHWVNEIIRMLRDTSLEKGPPKEKFFVEMTTHREWENLKSTRVFNTHLPPPLLQTSVLQNKIVLIIRNFKDVYVSDYHHVLTVENDIGQQRIKSWDHFFDVMLEDTNIFRYYHEWMKFAQENSDTVLVLYYEHLKEDIEKYIAIIASFLGMERDVTFYKSIAQATGIESMKSAYKDQTVSVDDTGVSFSVGGLYRKGIVGDWKNWFTPDQNRRFAENYKREMAGITLGIEKFMDIE